MNSNSDESNNKPSIPNAIDPEKLAGMEFVAKMRATADKYGAGFIGGFKHPKTGEHFINSNIDENDPIYQRTKRKLQDSDPEQ